MFVFLHRELLCNTLQMKNISAILVLLACQISLLCSCMGEKEVETTPECAILSMSVGDIKSMVTARFYRADGEPYDTVISRTIGGKGIYFNVDQLGGRIYATDSLPNWANLTKVCPSCTSYGNVYIKQYKDSLFYPLTSGKDSIDLTKPAELIAIATNGQSFKRYTFEINKSAGDIDTLVWSKVKPAETGNMVFGDDKPTALRSFCHRNTVYVFFRSVSDELMVSSTRVGEYQNAWHIAKVQSAEGKIDGESIIMGANQFYALNTEGHICVSADGMLWTVASTKSFEQLMAVDDYYMYAMSEGKVYFSADMQSWTLQDVDEKERMPVCNKFVCSYPSRTNANINIGVILGKDANGNAVSWYKVSAIDDDINQTWAYIQMTADNNYPMPNLDSMAFFRYKDALWLTGISVISDVPYYWYLYRSDDNGISWRRQNGKYMMPDNINIQDGQITMVAAGDDIIIVQANGNVWQGYIR